MIDKVQLLTIINLDLSHVIDKMDDKQFEEYCKIIDTFIESYPAQEMELKKAFSSKDYDLFSELLLSIWKNLTKMYAKGLAQDCLKLLSEIGSARYEIVEAHLTYLSTTISALSIDLQMVQHKDLTINETDIKSEPIKMDWTKAIRYEPKTILAVDDVSFLLNGLKSILQNTPYKFIGVTSGADALRFIVNHKPDLFLLDIEMPEMNGYELARKIKESGQTAPIIFLTGNSTKEYVLKALEVGAIDFIVKPISKENVLEKIRKYIL